MESFTTTVLGREGAHLNEDYWRIVDACWIGIQQQFPKTSASLAEVFRTLNSRDFSNNFDLIWGKVQSGKSRAIMTVTWYAIFMKTDVIPVILTIKLNSVRNDFIGKMSGSGELNKCIANTIIHEFPEFTSKIDIFQLQSVNLMDIDKKARSQWIRKHNMVPVLLQEPHNIETMMEFYFNLTSDRRNTMMVLIDEVHSMYTTPVIKRQHGMTDSKISNQNLMYWLKEKVANRKIGLIGITATHARVTADPHVHPNSRIILDSDPVKDSVYYGKFFPGLQSEFIREKERWCQEGFIPICHEQDEISVVKKILMRPHIKVNGTKIIKTILIMTERTIPRHIELRDKLQTNPNLVVHIINSDKDEGEQLHTIFRNLSTLPPQILTTGGLCLIGKGCFKAGVSIKPPPGVEIKLDVNGESYQLCGITDQIYQPTNKNKQANTLENNIQAMRLFGYYPLGVTPNLWLIGDNLEDKKAQKQLLIEQFDQNETMIHQYDGSPKSMEFYMSKSSYNLFEGDPYEKTPNHSDRLIQFSSYRPLNTDEHKAMLLPIGKWFLEKGYTDEYQSRDQPWLKISDFHERRGKNKIDGSTPSRSDVNLFRKRIIDLVKEKKDSGDHNIVLHDDFFQVAYDQSRYLALLRASIVPRQDEIWQVKSLLTGINGHNTLLEDMVLVVFKDPFLYGSSHSSDPGQNYYFQVAESKYVTVHKSSELSGETIHLHNHKYLDCTNLSEEHCSNLDRMEQLITQGMTSGKPPRNGWVLFTWYYKHKYGKSSLQSYSQAWKKCQHKSHFNSGVKEWNGLVSFVKEYERLSSLTQTVRLVGHGVGHELDDDVIEDENTVTLDDDVSEN